MIDTLIIDEMILRADKSYLRFGPTEWYYYEPFNIQHVANFEWLEQLYNDEKN
jgi:hypothetical protein